MRHPIAAALAATMLAGAAPAFAADAAATNEKAYRGFIEDAFNKHNVNASDKYLDAKFVDHVPMANQKPGIAGFKAFLAGMVKSTPDLHMTIDQTAAKGDLVVARITVTGTPKAPMMGMKPNGKAFKMVWIDWCTFKNGKMTEHWGYGNDQAMMSAFQAPAHK